MVKKKILYFKFFIKIEIIYFFLDLEEEKHKK